MDTPSRPAAPVGRAAASLLVALGLGLALGLALLKWRSLPCLGAGCDRVIQSRYGAFFGVPVGVFGAALWVALAAPLPGAARRAVHAALALGALGFMVVQFGILRAFCPYCTVHAVAAVAAWHWRRVRPAWWALALGAALAGSGYGLAQRAADRAAAAATPGAGLAAGADAWWPLAGATTPAAPGAGARPVLVLSLTCPACLDLLRELTEAPAPADRPGPAIYIKAEPRERALAVAWVAACRDLAGSTPRDRFMAVTAMLVAQRELATADPDAAAAWLAGVFQTPAEARAAAEALLARHAARLAESGIATTPWFLPPGGPARARVTAAEVW